MKSSTFEPGLSGNTFSSLLESIVSFISSFCSVLSKLLSVEEERGVWLFGAGVFQGNCSAATEFKSLAGRQTA